MAKLSLAALIFLICVGTAAAEQKRDIRGFVTGMPQAEVDLKVAGLQCTDSKKDPTNGPQDRRTLACKQPDGSLISFQFTRNNPRIMRVSFSVPRANPDDNQLFAFVEQTFSVRYPRDPKTNQVIADRVLIPGSTDWLSFRTAAGSFTVEIVDQNMFRDDDLQDAQKSLQQSLPKM